jgi:hypothetical protein
VFTLVYLGLFCYYIPFWGGTFWFYSRLDVDAVRVTTFFDWVVALTILFVWMGLGLGGIIVTAVVGEVLKHRSKNHEQSGMKAVVD